MSDYSAFLQDNPHLEEFSEFIEQLKLESDRGAVLIACSMIDELLARTIRAFLVAGTADALLDGFNAPAGTFAARTKLALALGLIDERTGKECDLLRKVRNEFAHKVTCLFSDPEVSKHCVKLTGSVPGADNPRTMFVTAAVPLILNLVNRPHYVGSRQLKYGKWAY